MTQNRPSVLVIGPTPPPFHGVAVATQSLLSAGEMGPLTFIHLDIADRRGIGHVDKPDLHDVYLFCKQWLTLVWLLIARRPAVVYLAISQSSVGFIRDTLFIGVAHLFRRKLVVHLHGGNFPTFHTSRGPVFRKFIRAMLGCSDRFIVLAESFRKELDGIIAPEKLVVVPNGISWRQHPTRPLSGVKSQSRVLFLSTLSRAKGALLLLEAAAQVRSQQPDVEFVLAGPWAREDDRRSALALIERHALTDHVRFPGEVSGAAKAELYESADLFVFPGLQQEGQPLVVLEAMAAALPIVYCHRGCLRETVVHGECGLEFAVGDSADLADRLLRLLAHPEERQRLGQNARTRYEACYSQERFISRMREVFLQALGHRTQGATG